MVKRTTVDRLLLIACFGLLAAGAVYLCASLFSDDGMKRPLIFTLVCFLLSGLFYIIRQTQNRRK